MTRVILTKKIKDMKKIIIINGLISGVIVASMGLFSAANCDGNTEFSSGSMILGFAVMLLAFSLNYVGIKNYRDKYNGGVISYGRALLVSLYMCLIASTIYVVGWMIEMYAFMPDWIEKYSAHALKAASEAGASAEELASKAKEMEFYINAYKSPLGVALITYMEILPMGILVSLIIALIVRRKAVPAS